MLANIIRNTKKTAIGGGGGGIVTGGDPYYSAVSLLLPMDGTNGSTTFTDSGPNAIAVTASGNAQISTTQSKYGGASGYFDGSGDYLDMPGTGVATAFGTGDFTIEFWYYPLSVSVQQNLVDKIGSASNAIYMSSAGVLKYYVAGDRITGATLSANTWYHIALVRYSGVTKLYVNGVQSGASYTDTNNYALNTGSPRIGAAFNNTVSVNGYIDDFRISLFARYTSTFTPPTAALPTTASSTPADPYYGYTSLLLHMDGTNASTNFVDSGPNALTVTASGDAKVSTGSPYFGTGAAIFDGSGDFLSVPSGTSVNFGTGDFTVEMWARYSSLGFSNNALVSSIGPTVGGLYFAIKSNLTFLVARAFVANDLITAAVTWPANTWAHIALSRSGSTMRVFKDGVLVSSVTNTQSYSLALSGNNDFAVGATQSTSGVRSQTDFFNGQIDDLRITKYARYTSAFAPPAQAHLEYANGNDRHFSNVSLLLHMDGANGSTTFTDNSANARTITAVGNAQISTTQSQFGGASAYFDGTGDYLSFTGGMPSGSGTAFTIECWIRLDDLSAYRAITRTAGGLDIGIQPNGLINCDQTSVGIIANSATGVITAGTWYHVAVTRDTSNNYKIYVNGTQVASATNSFTVTAATTIGYSAYSGSHYFKGYIDDFRVTNALRYTANFTPSTSAFPNA